MCIAELATRCWCPLYGRVWGKWFWLRISSRSGTLFPRNNLEISDLRGEKSCTFDILSVYSQRVVRTTVGYPGPLARDCIRGKNNATAKPVMRPLNELMAQAKSFDFPRPPYEDID